MEVSVPSCVQYSTEYLVYIQDERRVGVMTVSERVVSVVDRLVLYPQSKDGNEGEFDDV